MSEIRARYTGGNPEGVTLGVILDDGDLVPHTVKHGGELPTELEGRKVSTAYRDGLLAQEDNWSRVRRDTGPKTTSTAPAGKGDDK
jgi:hypothetical protein